MHELCDVHNLINTQTFKLFSFAYMVKYIELYYITNYTKKLDWHSWLKSKQWAIISSYQAKGALLSLGN